MNQKKAKQLRRITKMAGGDKETSYIVLRNSTVDKRQFTLNPKCQRGFYQGMKKALKRAS